MPKIYKYKGEDISEEFVTEGFEQSSFTILDDYIKNTNGLEVAEEKVEKPKDVVEKDATVTSIEPEQASESTELEQVNTSLVSEDPEPEKPLSASEKRIATRKKREQDKQDNLKAQAVLATDEIQTRIKEVPKEDIVAIQANDYFGPIKSRKDRTTVSKTMVGAMGPTMSFEPTFDSDESYTKYLKETLGGKYNQYLDYKETNEIVPLNSQNQSQLEGIYNEAEIQAKDKVYNNSLFNVPEDVQEYMVASPDFASGAESLEAQKFLIKEQKESIDQSYNNYDEAKKEWESQAIPLRKEAEDVKSQIDKFQFYFDGASQEQADQYNELVQTYNSKIQQWEEKGFNDLPAFLNSQAKLVNSQQKDYSKMLEDSRKALVNSDLFEKNLKKDYSVSARVGRAFDEFFVQSGRNFLDLTAELGLKGAKAAGMAGYQPLAFLTNPENSAKVDSLIETIQTNNKNYNLGMASKRENIPTAPSIDDIGKDGLSVWDWTSISLQDSSPIILTTFAPGGLGIKGAGGVSKAIKTGKGVKDALQKQKALWLAGKRTVQGTFFVAETGGKYGELQTDEASRKQEVKFLYSKLDNTESIEDKTKIYDRIKELEEVEDYSLLQKAFTSFGAGATATYLESVGTLKMLEPAKGLAKQIGIKAAKKELYKQPVRFGANLVGKTLSGLKSLPKNLIGETLEEAATEISHNALDILVLDENKSMFEGVDKDFIANTMVSSFGIMAPKTGGNMLNIVKSEFRTKNEIFDNQKLASELIELNESTTPENSKQLRARKKEILKELALSDAISLHKLKYMTADQIEEVADINRQMRQVNGKFSQLGGLGDLGEAENKRVKKQLEEEYSNLTTARQEILDAKQRSNTKKAANINKALGAAARNSEASFYYGVNDFYNDLTMTQMGDGDFISIKGEIIKNDDGQAVIKYENLDDQLAKYKEKLSEEEFNKFKKEIEDGDFNAKQLGKDIIVNQPVIDRNIALAPTKTSAQYAAVAPLEELFHLSVDQKGIKFDSTAKNAVLEAEKVLKEKKDLGVISEKDYNGLKKRFDLYRDGKDFNAEEFIAQMNNAISLGAINRSDLESAPSFKKFLNNTIRSTFGDMSWMLKLENSDDVFNLVKNFQTDVSKGVTFQAPEKDEVKTSLSEDIQNDLDKLEDSYFDGDIDEYQFEQKRDELERKLKQAEKEPVTEKAETEVEPTQQVEKIVKEATTKVFEKKEVSDKNKQIAKTNDDIVQEMSDLGANRISDIKDPKAKKAIVDKLGENNIGAVTELAKKAAATSRDLPIDDNLKVNYEEFFLGFSEELSALINSYKANVDGKKVPFGAYMNQNLRLRYGNILNRSLKGKLKGSESLSSDKNIKKEVGSFAEESSSEPTSRDEERVLDRIDVRKFGPAKDKASEISSIVEVEDGERPTYKQLADKFIEPVSMELFDVPGKKIQGKATLTDAEAKSLQRLFVSPDNVRKLIKTMPPYNVATSEAVVGEQGEIIDVSKDIKGRSIGLSNKFIKQFYQPVSRAIPGISSPKGRSLGETSQGQVYELKPEFKGRVSNDAVKQIQNSVGVTEAGVPNEKISAANRTKYGTTLTGFAKTYIANVINVTGRSKQTDKQEQADTAAGKSDIMLSKADKSFLAITGKDAKIDFNNKKIVKKLKQDVFSILGDSELGEFSEEDFVKYLLPLATKGYDYRFKTINGKRVLVDDSKNTRNVIFQGRKDFFESYNKYRKSKGLGNIKWKPRDRSITFKDYSGKNKTIKLATLKNQSTIGLNSGRFIETLEDRVLTAQDQRNGLKRIVVSLKKFVDKNPNDLTTVPMFLTMLNSNTDGLVRTAAIPKWIMYKEGLKDSDYVYEHTQTASDTIVELMRAIYNSKNNAELLTEFDNIMKHFDVAIIPKENDAKVNKLFKQNGPKQGDVSKTRYDIKIKYPGENGFPVRYEAANKLSDAGIKLESLTNFAETNKDITLGKLSKAEKLDKTFNDILEKKTGISSRKRYGIVEAITKGSSKGKFNFFIPPSAEDFVGLLYPTLSKGKVGDAQMSWYKKNLIDPYAEGMNKLSKARVYITNTYNQLKKQLDIVPKNLTKKVGETDYTKEQAVRVYIWKKQKMEVPGMSKKDVNMLANYVAGNDKLQSFADQLINLQLGDGYAKPKVGWPAGTITTDILEGLNTTKRAKYLSRWQQNVDAIFSEDNLNKLQAAYGVNYRKALEGTLERMKTGRNRNFAGDSMTGRFTDWLTGSIGAIMFFNTRSAVLQTISAANYINFEDNNIFAAGKAFANQKQYWSDFMKLINSDFLKERRGGLRMNVNEADISDMAKKGGARGVISKLLEIGFTPTQVADSFAIASGGSTFYRNRINTYKKQELSDKEAEKKAFEDFRETTEESQQSSRADRISQQQASPLGRIVLAFANAPAQYARIIKKAASDLKNGRGNTKANISRIIYYGAVQNLIFNALQQALFATAFGDEEPEDEEKEKKYISIANGMLDSILRGSGIGGAIVSVGKNTLLKLVRELEKDRPKLQNVAAEVLKISPAVSAKYSRLVQAGKSYDWNKEEMREKGLSLDNPAFLAAGNVVSALTNIPLDRAVKKANNVVQATTQDLQTWERIGLLGGWQDWELGIKKDKKDKLKSNKTVRKSGAIRKKVIRKKVVK